ncbi:MAG TPA: bifunctional serine/threonine-protein kinase/ABC transporter substrate-binding protein [Dehalococcoidia bacterium]|nr:bifunctional serine/threonine-protein kinase/ABC transporter substrate-binding protein [Dehalococcoidia bacterium]
MPDSSAPHIISHYQVDSLLGVGAMGSVYLGVDRRDGTLVAIKLIAQFLANDSEFRKRFEREAHVAALLRSPYAVRVLDYGVEAGQVFMAMEYVDGPTVRELLESGPLEPARGARIALQVARALEEAEARGIVHRDVKPDNIILGPEDTAKLADFGVARQDTSMLTQTGGFYGTASYAAPELFEGKADNRSDIYALGASLYNMLLDRAPVSGDLEQARRRIMAGDIAFADLAAWPSLRAVVEQAMATDPANRYQSARQMAGALESALVALGGASPSAAATVAGTPGTETDWRSQEETLRLALKGPTTSLPFGKRYAALKYELAITNQGHDATKVRLRAADRANACRFSLPESVSVPAGATSHVSFSVKPRRRRLRGPNLTRIFTVAGSGGGPTGGDGGGGGGGDDGGSPVAVSGRFEDASYGWLPLGMSGLALVIAIAALLVATVSTGASSTERDPALRIGVIMPTSGVFGDYGNAYLNSARIAVSEINDSGGVLGRPVELIAADSAGDPDTAASAARRLIEEEKVDAIITEDWDLVSFEVAEQVSNPMQIVQISIGQGFRLRSAQPDFMFRPVGNMTPATALSMAELVKSQGYSKVCSPYIASGDTDDTFHSVHTRFRAAVPDLNVMSVPYDSYLNAVVGSVSTECPGADATTILVWAGGPTRGPAPAQLLQEAANAGGGRLLLVPDLKRKDLMEEAGWELMNGSLGASTNVPDATMRARFLEAYTQLFGGLPQNDYACCDYFSVPYDAVYLLSLSAEAAGSTDSSDIKIHLSEVANEPGLEITPGKNAFSTAREALLNGDQINYEGASGPIELDENGDNTRTSVEFWRVDSATQSFVVERRFILNTLDGTVEETP